MNRLVILAVILVAGCRAPRPAAQPAADAQGPGSEWGVGSVQQAPDMGNVLLGVDTKKFRLRLPPGVAAAAWVEVWEDGKQIEGQGDHDAWMADGGTIELGIRRDWVRGESHVTKAALIACCSGRTSLKEFRSGPDGVLHSFDHTGAEGYPVGAFISSEPLCLDRSLPVMGLMGGTKWAPLEDGHDDVARIIRESQKVILLMVRMERLPSK